MDRSSLIRHNGFTGAVACRPGGRQKRQPRSIFRRRPMTKINALRCVLAVLAAFAGVCPAAAEDAAPSSAKPLAVQLSFDRPLEASMAPFIAAASRGMFAAEGLSLRTDVANGSPDAIARVA